MPMRAILAALAVAVSACGASLPRVPPETEARAVLDDIIDAGLARDWERLCANASGTCERELDGMEALAPRQPPRIAGVSVVQPVREGDGWRSGGVLFVLCGTDATASPYESEVLVFDDGEQLLATAAVYWVGTRVSFARSGEAVTPRGPNASVTRCG